MSLWEGFLQSHSVGSGAGGSALTGGVTPDGEARCGTGLGTHRANNGAGPGKVLSRVFAVEMREERTEVCGAQSCSAEAGAAVQVLHGGWGEGFYYCL